MGFFTLYKPLDLLNLDVTFPLTSSGTGPGNVLFDNGAGWQMSVTITSDRVDVARDLGLFRNTAFGYEKVLNLSEIDDLFVPPLGGTVQSLLSLIMDSADVLKGTGGRDSFSGYRGDDMLYGKGGRDLLHGGLGDDTVKGGGGEDAVLGEGGNDLLLGGSGIDFVSGGQGEDILRGGRGNDRLAGGEDADTFFFRRGDGNDVIADFELGTDVIRIGRGAKDMDDLSFEDVGLNVVISFANVEITVENRSAAEMNDADNFLL